MLDGVCACINRRLDATRTDGVSGNLQVLPVSLFDDRRHFRHGEVVFDRHLDKVDIVEDILTHGLPRCVRAFYPKKFLLHDRLGDSGIETLQISTRANELTTRAQYSRAGDAAGLDRVP